MLTKRNALPMSYGLLDVGGIIYVDDGLISLRVLSKDTDSLSCLILNGGSLGSKKVRLKRVLMYKGTRRDTAGIKEIRKVLGEKGRNVKIIAKIESFAGIRNFAEIINECDGAMVARGDMGIEIPPQKVFIAQKMIISACNRACKPVICASQMLESMTYKPRATRAESNDVANAVLDGADCVMLSGESAKGLANKRVTSRFHGISLDCEAKEESESDFSRQGRWDEKAKSLATAIIVLASKPSTVHYISNFRPRCPIVFVTRDVDVAKRTLLYRSSHCFPELAGGKVIFRRMSLLECRCWGVSVHRLVLSLDFLSTVVLNLALVFQRLICYSSALLLRRHTETSHLSPVDFHSSFGCKSPTAYT
ncbi:pyruvate kinase [Plakobranchus ocellatus]|uniref:Pyruvate kinase n=1 Tax=Plakobranchus ocellatus TaxID=259542 RepID=A0AAV4C0U1_9GAST|nr:pyruvate kinase [Plakobranchus ocellatus]